MNRKITFKETIELFLTTTIYDITDENEIPKINFIFNEQAYDLFYEIMKNPLELNIGWKPNIKEENIQFLKTLNNKDYPRIYVKDHIKFFTYLTDITNYSIETHNKYKLDQISRTHLKQTLKRREDIIVDAVYRELYEPKDFKESKRLNLLANLIADGRLDVDLNTSSKNEIGKICFQ